MNSLFNILVFPGFLFLILCGWVAQYVDRKLYAKLQNRVGPPWYQPVADFIKLASKEEVIPSESDKTVVQLMPVVALTSTVTAFLYIPLWGAQPLYAFTGDIIVVLYLLTIPTLTYFLGGWYSRSIYAMIGAVRSLTQLFAYEVPLFLSVLAAALLADSWSLKDIVLFYSHHPLLILCNSMGFVIALIALLGKLEKVPFDIPEAETEIVAGSFTEYSGRLFALFRLSIDIESVVGASLLAAVFLPFGMTYGALVGGVLFVFKVFMLLAMMALCRALFARLRIDQMINLCWRVFSPLAFLQVLINLILKGVIVR